MSSILPPEIWHSIFSLATPISPQATDIRSVIDDWPVTETGIDSLTAQRRKKGYGESTKIKLGLVLVCKEWYNMAIQPLYEDVRPVDMERLRSLLEVLKAESCTLGRFIRHLRTAEVRIENNDDLFDLLVELAPHLPNLKSLFIEGWCRTGRDHDRLARQLATSCPTVEYFFAHQHWYPAGDFGIIPYLQIPSLKYYNGLWNQAYTKTAEHDKLTALALAVAPDLPPHAFRLPSLRHVHLRGNFCFPIPGVLRFFEEHGPQLYSFSIDDMSDGGAPIDDMLQHCTALREFLLVRPRSRNWRVAKYPSVRTFGLRITTHDELWRTATIEAGELSKVVGLERFPNLERVRVVDFELGSASNENLKRVEGLFVNRGRVIFEDAVGRPIADPSLVDSSGA